MSEQFKIEVDMPRSYLLQGDGEMGMTDNQYKGMLIDQLRSWTRVHELAVAAESVEIEKLSQEQIDDINAKLKF